MAAARQGKTGGRDPRRLACEILDRLEAGAHAEVGALVDRLDDDRDVRLTTELVYGTLRSRAELDLHIEGLSHRELHHIHPELLSPLRIGLYQILHLDRVPPSAAVNESVRLAKRAGGTKAAGFVNAVLRSACRNRTALRFPEESGDPASGLALRYSVPVWLVSRWLDRRGEKDTRVLLESFSRPAPLSIWVNSERTDPSRLLLTLEKEGVRCVQSPLISTALRVVGGRPQRSRSFLRGEFYVQDEASQAISLLMAARRGEILADFCAAPGGKAFGLATAVGPEGRVLAIDWRLSRIRTLVANTRRLGLGGVWPVVGDLLGVPPVAERLAGVLVDAPCTGTGIMGRHPEIRWRRKPTDLLSLTHRQSALLRAAAALVAPGGRLVYSVCSLEPEEGEERVEEFLSEHPDYRVESVAGCLPPSWSRAVTEEGFFRSWPPREGTDGFFAARLRRG